MDNKKQFLKGIMDMIPLNVSCVPWGILVGSLAVSIGLNPLESQAMSMFIFAGAGQLVTIGLLKAGAGLSTIFLTTLFITARHLLYSISMRDRIKHLPLRWRLSLGFLLTDEMFVLNNVKSKDEFNVWYALGSGFSFYLGWNAATLVGVLAGSYIPHLEHLGLDFTVVGVFIALIFPLVTNIATLATVGTALLLSVLFAMWSVPASLLLSAIIAMCAGYMVESLFGARPLFSKVENPETQGDES